MQKKIIVLAIASAFSASAFAENSGPTWYGKVYVNAESVKNDKIVAPNKDSALRVLSNASRLGVKGSEDLGDGLSGIYQFEVQVDADGTSTGKGFGSGTRNSGVGLEGGFGKVIAGVWDTPFKVTHNKIELFDNTSSFTALNLMGQTGVTAVNYNTRQSSVVEYWTPKLGSIQGAVSYSPDPAPTTTRNKSKLSLSGTFDQDGIYAALGYENRPDATTAGQTDSALRLVGRFDLGDAWLGAAFETIKVNTSATASYSQKNVELVGQYKMGSNKIALSYAKAGSTATTATGAKQLSLRYGMDFSKRTEFFVAYTSLKNDTGGAYPLTNMFGVAGQQTGSKQTVIGAGLIHSF